MTEKTSSDGARRAFDAEAQRGGGATPNSWYEASDSEREQPGWRVPKSTSPEAEREARKGRAAAGGSSDTDTDSDTSAWDTDDESLLENMAIAARRARRVRPDFDDGVDWSEEIAPGSTELSVVGMRRWRRRRSRLRQAAAALP